MGNPRKKHYIDLYLNDKDIRAIRKGYVCHCVNKGIRYVIHPIADKKMKKIQRLMRELDRLKRAVKSDLLERIGKRPYTKKNTEFWNKGGNIVKANGRKQ